MGTDWRPQVTRFWDRVNQCGPDECWEWTGTRTPRGYGMAWIGRGSMGTHRVAWMLTNRLDPTGWLICHTCDNPPCCNPAHLFRGTNSDNQRDKVSKGRDAETRKTHCPANHPYDAVNTYITPKGHRQCRRCKCATQREYHARKTAQTSTA